MKRFVQSRGLDTALYENVPLPWRINAVCLHSGCTWEHETLGDHLVFGNRRAEKRLEIKTYDRSLRPFYLTGKE